MSGTVMGGVGVGGADVASADVASADVGSAVSVIGVPGGRAARDVPERV